MTKSVLLVALSSLTFAVLTGCASEYTRMGSEVDTSYASHADGAAYVGDAMSLNKPESVRPASDDLFYYKTCNQVDGKAFYSMTSYECSEP